MVDGALLVPMTSLRENCCWGGTLKVEMMDVEKYVTKETYRRSS